MQRKSPDERPVSAQMLEEAMQAIERAVTALDMLSRDERLAAVVERALQPMLDVGADLEGVLDDYKSAGALRSTKAAGSTDKAQALLAQTLEMHKEWQALNAEAEKLVDASNTSHDPAELRLLAARGRVIWVDLQDVIIRAEHAEEAQGALQDEWDREAELFDRLLADIEDKRSDITAYGDQNDIENGPDEWEEAADQLEEPDDDESKRKTRRENTSLTAHDRYK
jgi:hypothetical protein